MMSCVKLTPNSAWETISSWVYFNFGKDFCFVFAAKAAIQKVLHVKGKSFMCFEVSLLLDLKLQAASFANKRVRSGANYVYVIGAGDYHINT